MLDEFHLLAGYDRPRVWPDREDFSTRGIYYHAAGVFHLKISTEQ
ncbi:hypothetical protein ACFSCZ_19715 [Siminovitchia sediminis]|uniref:Uncharacterized protein n=1 Tax=Siminovitchia sediminis TaxID=1274353 RepID=A0ABW4KPZ4_9BACI